MRTPGMRPTALVVLALLARPLAAQQPTAPDTSRRDSIVSLTPLTIRAAGERASVLDVPLAITRVLPADRIGGRGLGLDELLAGVPGVIAQSRAGGGDIRLSIRGFGSRGAGDRSNAGTSRGVRVLLDGVPETEPDGRTSFDLIDQASLASIEVIRSNASSLWGNAAGGVVSISSLDPAAPPHVALESSVGGFGLFRSSLTAGAPLAGGAVRATVVRSAVGGWRDHSDGERTLVNAGLLSRVGPRTQVGVYAAAADNFFRIPGPLTRQQLDSAPAQANATYAGRDERRHNRLGRLAVTVDQELGRGSSLDVTTFVAPKYLQRSERGTFRDFTRYHVGGSVVAHAPVSLGAPGVFTAGLDEAYQDGAILFYSLDPVSHGRGDTLRDNKREGANNVGLFVQHAMAFGRLDVSAGARYDAIAYYSDNYIDPSIDASRTFSRVTPKLAVIWHASPRRSFYANMGGGVEVPAGNETDPAGTFGQDTVTALNPLLEPIRSTTLEVGTKHVIQAGGAVLSYDLAAYRTVVQNEIIPYRGGRFYFTAGEAQRSGVELGAALAASHGARLGAAVTWAHHRYTDYQVDSVHYGVPGAVADYSGNRVVGVPDLTYTLTAGHDLPGGVLGVGVMLQGMSRWYADDANTVGVPAFGVVHATLETPRPLPLGGVGLRGSVTVNNVFDARYVASAFLNPDVVGGVPVAFEAGLPRHVVVALHLERRGG